MVSNFAASTAVTTRKVDPSGHGNDAARSMATFADGEPSIADQGFH